jgi:hypothetical protein
MDEEEKQEKQEEQEKQEKQEEQIKIEKLQKTEIIGFILQQLNHIKKENKDLILENFKKINFEKINIVLDLLKDKSLSDNLFELISNIQSKSENESSDNQDDVILGFFELLIKLSDEKMKKLLDILLTKFREDKKDTDVDGQILCISLLNTFNYEQQQQQRKLNTPSENTTNVPKQSGNNLFQNSYIPNILENFVKSLIIIDELGFIYRLFQLLKLLNDSETNTYFKILNNIGGVEQCKIIIKLIGILVFGMRVDNITKLIQILGNSIFMKKMIFNQKIALLWVIINKRDNSRVSFLTLLHTDIQKKNEDDFIYKIAIEIQRKENQNATLITLNREQKNFDKYQELVDKYNFENLVKDIFKDFEEVYKGFEENNANTTDIKYDTSKYYTRFTPFFNEIELKRHRDTAAAERKAKRKAAQEAKEVEKAAQEKKAAAASSNGRKRGQAADSRPRGKHASKSTAASSRGRIDPKAAASSRGSTDPKAAASSRGSTDPKAAASSRGSTDPKAAASSRESTDPKAAVPVSQADVAAVFTSKYRQKLPKQHAAEATPPPPKPASAAPKTGRKPRRKDGPTESHIFNATPAPSLGTTSTANPLYVSNNR